MCGNILVLLKALGLIHTSHLVQQFNLGILQQEKEMKTKYKKQKILETFFFLLLTWYKSSNFLALVPRSITNLYLYKVRTKNQAFY